MMKKKLNILAISRGKANDDDDDLYLPIPGIYPPSHPQLPKWSHSWIELMVWFPLIPTSANHRNTPLYGLVKNNDFNSQQHNSKTRPIYWKTLFTAKNRRLIGLNGEKTDGCCGFKSYFNETWKLKTQILLKLPPFWIRDPKTFFSGQCVIGFEVRFPACHLQLTKPLIWKRDLSLPTR